MTQKSAGATLARLRRAAAPAPAATTAPEPQLEAETAPPATHQRTRRDRMRRYTFDLEPDQHRWMRRYAFEAEIDASVILRTVLRMLESDLALSERVLDEARATIEERVSA